MADFNKQPFPDGDRQALKEARLCLRLTLQQAEAATGTKWGSIADWEAGRCGGLTGTVRQRIYDYLDALSRHAVAQGLSPERCLPWKACPGLFAPPLTSAKEPQEDAA